MDTPYFGGIKWCFNAPLASAIPDANGALPTVEKQFSILQYTQLYIFPYITNTKS